MKGGSNTSWKIFRAVCIVQLILVAFKGMLAFGRLFNKGSIMINFIDIVAYALVFVFVYHGLSILNYNYPDTPLSPKQKRLFNILYLINFILIAYLFAQVVNNWWLVMTIFDPENPYKKYIPAWTALFLFPCAIFIMHLVMLIGMFRLRRLLHENTINTWYEQFDQKP